MRGMLNGLMMALDKSNGRWIRNLDEQLTKTMADRVVAQGSDDIETILNSDIDAVLNQGKYQAEPTRKKMGWLPSTVWLELLR